MQCMQESQICTHAPFVQLIPPERVWTVGIKRLNGHFRVGVHVGYDLSSVSRYQQQWSNEHSYICRQSSRQSHSTDAYQTVAVHMASIAQIRANMAPIMSRMLGLIYLQLNNKQTYFNSYCINGVLSGGGGHLRDEMTFCYLQ